MATSAEKGIQKNSQTPHAQFFFSREKKSRVEKGDVNNNRFFSFVPRATLRDEKKIDKKSDERSHAMMGCGGERKTSCLCVGLEMGEFFAVAVEMFWYYCVWFIKR